MKNIFFNFLVLISGVAMLAACNSGNTQFWDGILEQYKNDPCVDRILLVKCGNKSLADAQYYMKENGEWFLRQEGKAHIGKAGLGKTIEGDMKTPEGDFDCWVAYGILPDPGTDYKYIKVTESIWACEDEGPYYNYIVDADTLSHPVTGEHMIEYAPAYNYGLHIAYNPDHIYPLGNSIFLHGKGRHNYTAGCVALDEPFVKRILTDKGTAFKICIHKK